MGERLRHAGGRLLGRLVTSPAAFALAVAVDLAAYWFSSITARWPPGRGFWRAR